jgi:hypothetical protein
MLSAICRASRAIGTVSLLLSAAPALGGAQEASGGSAPDRGSTGYVNPLEAPRPSAKVVKATGPIAIDGRLNEADWSRAPVLADFVQQLPNTGMPAQYRTEVRLLYDAQMLYVAAMNFDPEPHKAIIAGLERDFNTGQSDIFGLALDTFHDKRNAFLWALNPGGAWRDEQVFNDSRTVVDAWEGVFWSRARIVPDTGWIVEMAIPMRTLRFNASTGPQDWGLNLIRRVRRTNETSYWAPLDRQHRLHRMSRAGTIEGLEGLVPGRNLQVKPFVLGGQAAGAQVASAQRGTRGDVGLDVKWGVTPSLTADATYNTDFAQVEVDQEQVNLTRFSLFFPERREFFIENAGSFTFGDTEERNYRQGASLRDFLFFNTRQIGLTPEGRPIPIVAGGRVSGRAGPMELGFLNMQTQSALGQPAENFGVARVKANVFGQNDFGLLFANRQANDGTVDRWNRSVGADANLRVGDLIVNSYAALSTASDTLSDGSALRVSAAYRGRFWNNSVMYKRVSDDFNPGMGFVRRRAMQQTFATVGAHMRPAIRGIQEVAPYAIVDYYTDLRGAMDTRAVTAGLDLLFQPDGQVQFTVADWFDRLERPFPVFPGRSLPVGSYAWREASAQFTSSQQRPFFGSAGVSGGGYYDGTRRSANGSLTWRARPELAIEVLGQANAVRSPTAGAFDANLLGTRVRYAVNPNLYGSAFIQYNTQTNTFSTNVRANWRWAPLSDVFLVYTERQDITTGMRNERSVVMKVTRMVQF